MCVCVGVEAEDGGLVAFEEGGGDVGWVEVRGGGRRRRKRRGQNFFWFCCGHFGAGGCVCVCVCVCK